MKQIKQWFKFHVLGEGPHGVFCMCPKILGSYIALGCPNPGTKLMVYLEKPPKLSLLQKYKGWGKYTFNPIWKIWAALNLNC